MKRTIYIMRHAEAESFSSQGDKARMLTAQGKQAATALAEKLRARQINPAIIFCSPAQRTRQTAESLALKGEISHPDKLYNAPASELYEQIKSVPEAVRSVLIIAHNPGVSDLVRFLTGTPMCFAPGVFAVLETESDSWGALMPAAADLAHVL